jgi:hypothetical protein
MSKARTILGWAVAASLSLSGCGSTRQQSAVSNAAYQKALSDARQQGIPVTTQALAQPASPDSQNAAPVYSKLTAVLAAHPLTPADQDAELYYHLDNPSPAQIAQARRFLARRGDILTLAHQAASRPQCVFNRPWNASNSEAIDFPELKSARDAARILSMESRLMAQSGHTQDAIRNEALAFRVARQAGSDGLIFPALVEIASDAITLRTLQNILRESHGNPQTARAVRQAIDQDFLPPSAATVLKRETAMQLGEIAWLRQTGPDGLSHPSATTMPRFAVQEKPAWDGMMNSNGAYILTEMQKMIASANLPYPTAYAREEAITKQEGAHPAKHLVPLPWTPILDADQAMRHTVGQMVLPAPSGLVQKRALVTADAAVTHTSAALLEYRAAHGSFPPTLDQAISPVPADPFDLNPLRHRREGAGFVVYSVGPTLHFDGGTLGIPLSHTEAAFRYP